ncbi:MAG: hypothetical protein MPW14_14795 [Candidatus Manganitrophus sp.]|nr:MAG: hypothetical protein MPW14_14795 [Candidatus Manganitrophus sp.]
MSTALLLFLVFIAITLGDHLLGGQAVERGGGFFSGESSDHRLAKRFGDRRGLHVGGFFPGDFRAGVRFSGFDGLIFSIGWLVGCLTVLAF